MAQRWLFEEDYIVCKYCLENRWAFSSDVEIELIKSLLEQAGFSSRSNVAIKQRARNYDYLIGGGDFSYVPKQVQTIYGILTGEEFKNHFSEVQAFIKQKSRRREDLVEFESFMQTPDDSIHMVHTAKGRKFIDVLENYIQNSGIRPKSRIYSDIGMKQETYSAIRRGKYPTVSRENVYRLCFGLRLRYEDAIILINSCGYAFRGDSVLDSVVEYFLIQGPTEDSVNIVYENNDNNNKDENANKKDKKRKEQICYIYDTDLIDADLLESKVPALFWGSRRGDDRDDD